MWKTYECSAQGRSHIKEGIPCQDKTFATKRNGVFAIALADGEGSASMSHYGAETVTKTCAIELCDNFESYWNESDVAVARYRICSTFMDSLHKKARELQCETKDLASTLLVVAAKKDRFIIIHLGDGVVGYLKNDELKVASLPNNGEFANTTVFTTSHNAEGQIKMIKAQSSEIQGFIIMSDGPETCLYNTKENTLASGLFGMLKDAAISDENIVNENIQETMQETIVNNTFDDCSIAIMVRGGDRLDNVEEKKYVLPITKATEELPTSNKERNKRMTYLVCLIVAFVIVLLMILYFVHER